VRGCSLEIGRWLSPGDELELAIEGVGSVRNRIGAPR
jgi:2-keto-4-pentenoate hydratase/2-oxohepta-3-ene-1,7-dioic acid hydratase in catechol pathway